MTQSDEQDEILFFKEADAPEHEEAKLAPWKILIVDDDEEVHVMTRLVLRDLVFDNRSVELISARSGGQAKELLDQQADFCLILLDVVMESDDAGLQLVHYIRRELDNNAVRIILRTGQAGHAPEKRVILDYDINDYKEKTELTSQKLVTAVIASLRSYDFIQQIVELNQQLEEKVRIRTRELEEANIRLQSSLSELEEGEKAGRRIQFKLLPKDKLQVYGFRFSHLLLPSDYMSGDFVDYFAIDDRYVGFYMADVSGHGVSSAFVTVYLKRFISAALDRYRRQESTIIIDPAALLDDLNQTLIKEDMGKHVALFYGVLDSHKDLLRFTNAGVFPWPLLLQDDKIEEMECKGTPAGLFDFSEYQEKICVLQSHFSLYVFSDGVLECIQGKSLDQQLSELRTILSPLPENLYELAKRIGATEEGKLPDDLTLLSVER
ncbi:PP2C family protein-serine/threonine phosphatase [Lacimicrobium alkaliphilum]|uniref:Fused response regulator/phosphatase n=1 Tax=Lacimicrobium alkaliphilum TaxID=1526571 RepID=A0ABQ1RIR7_9ALTE|nr:SpoIIE family protein phosphatase [Lacimicrobium alkaliphilum]GGD71788.1 fused response regulator/phosphatase [Lacimicrobium alkaliphilum]